MPSCLGLYIENNIIKYAKISKEHENYRIDSFGMKFYDNIEETIKQIISETYSYKTPISVNLSDEKYTYSQLFNLLNKKFLEKAIATEFEVFCNENGKNRNALEFRNLLVPNLNDKDKTTSVYAYAEKSNIIGRLQLLDSYRVNNIVPLPLTIPNILNAPDKNNCVIINMEKNTSVTTIVNGQIQRADIIENGMKEILDSILLRENSYAKAYEICKNATIYTTQGRNLQVEENEYLEDIMPVLYRIIEKLKDIIISNEIDISNIYITGLAAVINNIDLYFEENFPDKKCEILTPFFIKKTNIKLNIKDYIEVNSAISLALQGLGIGNKDINFKKNSKLEQVTNLFNTEKDNKKEDNKSKSLDKSKIADKIRNSLKSNSENTLDKIEVALVRAAVFLIALLIICGFSVNFIMNKITNKQTEMDGYISDTQSQIDDVVKNKNLISQRTEQYNSLIEKINQANQEILEHNARKNALPNFLIKIKTEIPENIQIISIKNSSGKVIKMEVQSNEYEQLGYFIAKIKNQGILTDVTSTAGVKQNESIKITIQGNLPY